MHTLRVAAGLVIAGVVGAAVPAEAQRLPFERSFDVSGITILDVSTVRGKIAVTAGEPGRVVVSGAATIRIGWDVPANAAELARKVAAQPPVEKVGNTVRLRTPGDSAERRAVTISYDVRVPPDTQVLAVSESGATSVSGLLAPVVVRTQSGAIELSRLGGSAEVTSGSGSVNVDGVGGSLTVATTSSAITARELHAGLHVRTSSGAVDASLTGRGDVDVQTSSSAILLRGVTGGLRASTRSGRVTVGGVPGAPWEVSSGSGSLDVRFDPHAGLALEADSGSGSVKAEGGIVVGAVSKRRITGTVGTGGPRVRLTSRSGSIRISVGPDR
jgi:Putative adhesin